MKKIMVLVVAGIMAIMATGCGEETKPTQKTTGIQEIKVEEIQVEEIQVEEILTEKIYIDGEYKAEVEYNSKVNTWDNIPIQTF